LTARWWDAPVFYPIRGAFAFSETLLSLTIVSTPLQWLGATAVEAYNVVFVLSFFSAAIAAHALAHRLTGRHDVSLLAGLACGFSPYRAAQMPHLQTLVSCWMPLGLLALHGFVNDADAQGQSPERGRARGRSLVLFGVCWLLNGLTTGYFLFFFPVLIVLWLIWFVRSARDAAAIVVTAGMASVPLVPLLVSYQRHQAVFGLSRTITEILGFGADVTALWASSDHTWLSRHWTAAPRAEGELYPGVVVLALVITGAVVAVRRRALPRGPRAIRTLRFSLAGLAMAFWIAAAIAAATGGWTWQLGPISISTTHPFKTVTAGVWLVVAAILLDPRIRDAWRRRSVFGFYTLGAVVMFVFAWGPAARAFGMRFWYQSPYLWLMRLPGGGALRVPARFATLMILCLSQAAALAAVRLAIGRRRAGAIVAALAAAIALDGWVLPLKTDATPAPIALGGLPTATPVLELPPSDLFGETTAMLHATVHGHPIINGYSGYAPPHAGIVSDGLRDRDPTVLDAFATLGPFAVYVNRAQDEDGKYRDYVGRVTGAKMVSESGSGTLFTIAPRPPVAPDPTARRVTPASATVSETSAQLTFSTPVTLSRIELDSGAWPADFPRTLRISAGDDNEHVVWEGGLAGPAILSLLRDPKRLVVPVELPATALATRYVFAIVDPKPEAKWPVRAIRAYVK